MSRLQKIKNHIQFVFLLLLMGPLILLKAQIQTVKGYSETASGMLYYDFKAASDQKERIYRYTICPDSAACISLDFNLVDHQEEIDFIKVYMGENEHAPFLTTLGGKSKSLFLQSQTECITVEFKRDQSALKSVWTATWNGSKNSDCIRPMEENPCANVQDICGPDYHENFHFFAKEKPGAIETVPIGCLTSAHNPSWYRFVAQKSGRLSFRIQPDNGFDDFDWVLLKAPKGNTKACPESAPETEKMACNYAAGRGPNGSTGMGEWGDALSAGSAENPFCKSIDAKQGEVFFLFVDDFSKHSSGFTIHFNDIVMPCTNPKKDLLKIAWNENVADPHVDPRTTFSKYTRVTRIDLNEKANLPLSECQLENAHFQAANGKALSSNLQLKNQKGIVSALLTGLQTGVLNSYQPQNFVQPLHYGDLLILAERQSEKDSLTSATWWNPSYALLENYHQVIELITDEIFDKNTGRKRQIIRYIRLLWTDRDGAAPDFNVALFKYEEVSDFLDGIAIGNRHNDVQSLSLRDFLEGQKYSGVLVSKSHKSIPDLKMAKFSGVQQVELENYIWE